MDFAATDRIAAPREAVYRYYSDVARIEALARGRGADVSRRGGPALGTMTWEVNAPFRGRVWHLTVAIAEAVPAERLAVDSRGGGLSGGLRLDFEDDGQGGTTVRSALRVRANTMPARLVLAPMKLAHGDLQRRFRSRMADFAARAGRACTG